MIIRENIPKQEPIEESSFLDRINFEESNLLEGKFLNFITGNSPYNKIMRDHEVKKQEIIDKYKKQDQKLEKKMSSIKRKSFSKEEVAEIVKNFDKACKAMNRWLLTLKPKIKLDAFNIGDGYTYEYDDTDDSYSLAQYISDTKRMYDKDDNDLSNVSWNYGIDWSWPKDRPDDYNKQIMDAKEKINDEFKKFIKANGFKEESYAGGRMNVGYGSSKYPNIGVSYNIKDDEFGIFVDCTIDTTK